MSPNRSTVRLIAMLLLAIGLVFAVEAVSPPAADHARREASKWSKEAEKADQEAEADDTDTSDAEDDDEQDADEEHDDSDDERRAA